MSRFLWFSVYIKNGVVSDVLDVITCAKFQNEIFRGYDFTGDQIFHFPIDFWIGLTTVQHYCAAYDIVTSSSCGQEIVESVALAWWWTVLYVSLLCRCWEAGRRGHCGQSGVHDNVLRHRLSSTSNTSSQQLTTTTRLLLSTFYIQVWI